MAQEHCTVHPVASWRGVYAVLRWFMQGCCGSFSSPGRSDVPFWTRISKWTSLCAAGAFTSRAADYTVSPVVALAQLSCAVAVFFFLTHTPSSTVRRALSWFRAPEKPTWIYSLTRLLSSSAVLDICGRVLGKSRGGPCSVWLCHGLGRGPLFFVSRFHNAEALASLLRGFCDSRMPSPVVEGLHATSVRIF